MKKAVFRSTLMLGLLLSMIGVQAQDYTTGIGVRGGVANGITVKHFIGETAALEGIVASRWRGWNITGLYEKHARAFQVPTLNWYYGGGAHIGFWNGNHVKWAKDDKDYTVIGIDGILGLEYTFKEVPFNISIDWKPSFNLSGYNGFWGDNGALSVRYVF